MARKVLIIGIDGFDPILIERWKGELPNLRRMEQTGAFVRLRSVFPPDSVPAWASIYTGLNPARHGLLQSIDYLGSGAGRWKVDFGPFRGLTFWDLAGEAGKRVCIINPFLAYPAWPVNGIMVSGPVFMGGEVRAYPQEVLQDYRVPSLGGIVDFPTRKTLAAFCQQARQSTIDLAQFGLNLFRREEWDLYFICFLTADRIQHFLWRYCDPQDPTCPDDESPADTIKQFYILFDGIVGQFWELAGNGWTLLVLSDHGHGRRSTKTMNVNEFLRRKGYLTSRARRLKMCDHRFLLERLKAKALDLAFRWDLEDLVSSMAKWVPHRKALKDSSFITDRQESLAYTPDFAGRNPFGGIRICRDQVLRRGLDYEDVRQKLIDEMALVQDPQDGHRVVKWMARREQIYSGPYLEKYPDVVFELDDDYGVSWDLHGQMVGTNPTHKKISGGHRIAGALLLANMGEPLAIAEPGLMDIAPTVLGLLGIDAGDRMEGASLFR